MPIPYHGTFTPEQFEILKRGLKSLSMDEKWIVFYDEPYILIHRSWTGQPVYRVSLKTTEQGIEVTEALWAKDLAAARGADRAYQAQLVDFLLSNLVLHQHKPFPLPKGLKPGLSEVFQHHISGTGYPATFTARTKPWWRFWSRNKRPVL